jgi:hypothetical protein
MSQGPASPPPLDVPTPPLLLDPLPEPLEPLPEPPLEVPPELLVASPPVLPLSGLPPASSSSGYTIEATESEPHPAETAAIPIAKMGRIVLSESGDMDVSSCEPIDSIWRTTNRAEGPRTPPLDDANSKDADD